MTASPGVDGVRRDPFCLDRLDAKSLKARPRVIVTNGPFLPVTDEVSVKSIAPPPYALQGWWEAFSDAVRLMLEMRRSGAVGLISLGARSGSVLCFLSSFGWLRGGPVVAYQVHMPARAGRLKTYLIGRALRNVALIAVWSRAQIENYHQAFGIPRDKLVFIPYKANHSRDAAAPLPVGDYIFSGGNSERDYKTLFAAVGGLPIPVVVSTTKPEALGGLDVPENVILVSTEKVAFERLMAGSRLVALCLKKGIIRGSGEATVLNAMWHGKPVIAADDVSALDYIDDGVDGFVVPAGSIEGVRRRILELWKDPALTARMGGAARGKVAGLYTHQQWKDRMQVLAMFVYSEAKG